MFQTNKNYTTLYPKLYIIVGHLFWLYYEWYLTVISFIIYVYSIPINSLLKGSISSLVHGFNPEGTVTGK